MTTTPIQPEVVRDFLAVVVRCLRSTVGLDAVVAAASEPHESTHVRVALEVAGDIRGPLTWVFPPDVALELVRRLLADPDPPAEAMHDGATELANILTGHATEVLEANGFRCEIGVPRIHEGEIPPGVGVRMDTAKGPIDVVLSLTSSVPS